MFRPRSATYNAPDGAMASAAGCSGSTKWPAADCPDVDDNAAKNATTNTGTDRGRDHRRSECIRQHWPRTAGLPPEPTRTGASRGRFADGCLRRPRPQLEQATLTTWSVTSVVPRDFWWNAVSATCRLEHPAHRPWYRQRLEQQHPAGATQPSRADVLTDGRSTPVRGSRASEGRRVERWQEVAARGLLPTRFRRDDLVVARLSVHAIS
jgi:hypothetical protein